MNTSQAWVSWLSEYLACLDLSKNHVRLVEVLPEVTQVLVVRQTCVVDPCIHGTSSGPPQPISGCSLGSLRDRLVLSNAKAFRQTLLITISGVMPDYSEIAVRQLPDVRTSRSARRVVELKRRLARPSHNLGSQIWFPIRHMPSFVGLSIPERPRGGKIPIGYLAVNDLTVIMVIAMHRQLATIELSDSPIAIGPSARDRRIGSMPTTEA